MSYYLVLSLISFSLQYCCQPIQNSTKVNWEEQLIHLQKTHRISSNHFSDIALDSSGNAYISFFQKASDGSDEMRLVKVDPDGELKWKLGHQKKGRAMSIAIDQQQNIWITGVFDQELEFSQFKLKQKSGIFLAQFNQKGECLNLIGSQEHAITSDIAINTKGEILIGGKMGSQLSFGDTKLENKTNKDQSFLALFSSNKKCKWIKPMEGQIRRIRSHPDGSFYVGGSFYSRFSYQGDTIYTNDEYDQDGFLLHVIPRQQKHALRTYGQEGNARKGYRSSEGVSDIAISSSGLVAITLFQEQSKNKYLQPSFYVPQNEHGISLLISILKAEQNEQKEIYITDHHQQRSISSLTFENDSTLWVSGNHYFKNSYRSFLSRVQLNKKRYNVPNITHGTNMLFRSMDFKGSKLVAAGHFQDSLTINQNRIENNGEHSLFFYSIKKDTNHAEQH